MSKPKDQISTRVSTPIASAEDDMFADLPPLEAFDVKQHEIATHLAALMVHAGKNRTELAECIGWQKSRISRVLSGTGNLTLRTVHQFTECLGYDFDIVFRELTSDHRANQPWELAYVNQHGEAEESKAADRYTLIVRTADQIVSDYIDGTGQKFYVSGIIGNHSHSRDIKSLPESQSQQWLAVSEPTPAFDAPTIQFVGADL